MIKNYNFAVQKDHPPTKFFLLLLVLIAIILVSSFSVYRSSPVLFGIISFSFIVLLSYLFWKKAILIFLIWITLSGAVRKWLLPNFSDLVFLFNHALLGGIYVRYSIEQLKNRSPLFIKHPITIFLSAFFFWGLACAFNPKFCEALAAYLSCCTAHSVLALELPCTSFGAKPSNNLS